MDNPSTVAGYAVLNLRRDGGDRPRLCFDVNVNFE
jgi:hypothetical protein